MSLQLSIPKLSNFASYPEWARVVQEYLELEGLWSAVEVDPIVGALRSRSHLYETELLELTRKDKRAQFIIMCLLEDNILKLVVDKFTARSMWQHLLHLKNQGGY